MMSSSSSWTDQWPGLMKYCKQMLENLQDVHFWCWNVTGDEKWIYFRNPNNRNQWLCSSHASKPVVKQKQFEQVIMCIWWNFEGVLQFELVSDGHAVNTDLYVQQLQRVLVNRRHTLRQHDNATAHTANVTKCKLEKLDVLLSPAYSPDLAPSNNNVAEVENGYRKYFASKQAKW